MRATPPPFGRTAKEWSAVKALLNEMPRPNLYLKRFGLSIKKRSFLRNRESMRREHGRGELQ
jgi:hypothetical protein